MGAFDFRHEARLQDDISAVQHAAIQMMDKEPAWSRQLLNVATAASAWETLLHDPQVRRRYKAPLWVSYASGAALFLAVLSLVLVFLLG